MPIEPIRQEFHVGTDRHGRAVTLVRTRENGHVSWRISRAAHDQRDDSPTIADLPDDVMHTMAQVVSASGRGR